ncbi:MAG: putative Ig domain-containing protein [Saprospiraceae bacterium]|nr:putative Ig domain-containing protein [Saprospiraceae bacterium]
MDTICLPATWTVYGSSIKLQIESGGTLTATIAVTVATTATFQIDNGGTYIHNNVTAPSSNIFNGTENFDTNSTFEIWAFNNGTSIPAPAGGFGNLIINVTTLGGAWNQSSNLTNIKGNFILQNTATREFRLAGNTGDFSLTIGGNLEISNAILNFTNGTALATINIGGNLIQNMGGTIMQGSTAAPGTTINFTGGSSSNVSITLGGTYLNNDRINWTIAAGKTLANNTNFGAGSLVGAGRNISISGNFQVNEGSWTGSSGTWNYASGSSLIFNNSSGPYGPIDGNHVYWPPTSGPINVSVQNGGGIIMGVSRTVGGTFTLVTGTNAVQGTSLKLNGDVLINGGNFQSSPIYGTNSTLTYNTGGTYGRSNEWSANGVGTIGSTPGYPSSVVISNNTTLNLPNGDNTPRASYRDITINAGSSLYADYGGGSVHLTVGRSFFMAGNLSLGSSVGGDMVIDNHWTKTGGTFSPNNRAVFFNSPSGGQSITGATTFDYLIVDKSASSLELNNDITVNQTLTLSNGTITTNANKVIIASSGSVSKTNGWVNGNLEQYINTGATSKTFDIGSSNEYTPCSVSFGSVSSGGYLLAFANGSLLAPASGSIPAGSGISQTEYVSRGWTLTNTGISFNNYNATFNFQPGDIVGGGDPNVFIVGKNSGGTWSNPTVGTRTATSTQITGETSFSDFRIGESDCTPPSALVYVTNTMTTCIDVPANSNNVNSVAGSSPFSYSIMPALPTGLNINPTTGEISGTPTMILAATPYTVTAANACGNTTYVVTISVNMATATAANDGPKCAGTTLNLSSSGGSTYSWSGPNMFSSNDQNPTITNVTSAAAGIYTVQITDGNGCIDIETTNAIIIDSPTGAVSGGGSVCPGSTLPDVIFTFTGTAPFDFTYSDGSNTFNATSPTTIYSLTAAPVGTYTLTALSDDDCTAVMAGLTGSATNAYNAVPVLNTPAVIARCSGVAWGVNLPSAASGVVNAYRAESRTYSPLTMTFSSQIPNFFPAPGLGTPITVPEVWYNTTSNPGTVTYAISATTDGLCYGPAVDMTVTINPLPTAAISVSENSGTINDGTICSGASATLTASGGTSYQWDNMTTNAIRIVNPTSTTSYFVTVTDGNGCTDTETTSVSVNSLPMVNAGSYGPLCVSSTTQALSGNPMGGSFSGTGVSGNNFNASMAGAATHTITYNFTDGNGCTNSATTNIIVNALPMVNAGMYPAQCVSATTLALAGSPMGGTFSGPGVSGNNFNASMAGTGSKTITYTYTDGNGCTNSATTTINVNALPVVSAGSYPDQCFTSTMLTLTGSPTGGTFSGPGVSGNNFDASVAGVGMHTITYNYTDGNGCTNSATTTINVNALPVVNAGTYPAQCVNGTTLSLAGSPMGGTFSGPGVSGNNFNASLAGTGMHTITYNFTNGSGCSNSATTTIIVNGLPMVNAGSYAAQCVSATTLVLVGSPIGGTFSGPGVSGNNFNASAAGSGSHTITYSYTDGNGCTNTSTTGITVNALPIASITSSSDCGGANTTLMASGGTMYSWSTMENTQSIIVTTSGYIHRNGY